MSNQDGGIFNMSAARSGPLPFRLIQLWPSVAEFGFGTYRSKCCLHGAGLRQLCFTVGITKGGMVDRQVSLSDAAGSRDSFPCWVPHRMIE